MLKLILALISVLILSGLLFIYFIPFGTDFFVAKTGNSNFSLEGNSMQFYPNLRFPDASISYRISSDCTLKKQNDMAYAFDIAENLTSLEFFPVKSNEDISISCLDRQKNTEGGFFIAGEGGPTNITVARNFNVITHGEILLIREPSCEKPNVGLHELFHVLGFEHSANPGNIMYNVTSCDQTVGEDMLNLINKLYAVEGLPDLFLENASASLSGRLLQINMTIFNAGLKAAGKSRIKIYAGADLIKEVELDSFEIGSGRGLFLGNIFVAKVSVDFLEILIDSDFGEINKENNKVKLELENSG
jgi:hypothetical protein